MNFLRWFLAEYVDDSALIAILYKTGLITVCVFIETMQLLIVLEEQLKARTPIGDSLMNAPKNAKELMATGLLEGHHVRCTGRGEEVCVITLSYIPSIKC